MKKGYLNAFILMLFLAMTPSSTYMASTLAEVLYYYPDVAGMGLTLKWPTSVDGAEKEGEDIIQSLPTLTILPQEWVESTHWDKTPLDIVSNYVADINPLDKQGPQKIEFLSRMIRILLASGAKATLKTFELCANNPQCCVAFVESSNASFLQEVAGNNKSAIDILLDKIANRPTQLTTINPTYKKALDFILKLKGYTVPLQTFIVLSDILDTVVGREVVGYVIEQGVLPKTIDFSNILPIPDQFDDALALVVDQKPLNLFEKVLNYKKKELIPLMKLMKAKAPKVSNVIEIAEILAEKVHANEEGYEEYLKVFSSDASIGAECIKQAFKQLGPSRLSEVVEKIEKCMENISADLASKMSLGDLHVCGKLIKKRPQSLYYYLMAYAAPALEEQQAQAVTLMCNKWLKEQTVEIQAMIRNEKNRDGQIVPYAAIDLYGAQEKANSSLCSVVQCLGAVGFDPLVTAPKNYTPELEAAFNQGRTVGVAYLKKLEEMQAARKPPQAPVSEGSSDTAPLGAASTEAALPGPGASGSSLQLDTGSATEASSGVVESGSTSEGLITPKNVMIGSAITACLIGIAYGINRMMHKGDNREENQNSYDDNHLFEG